MPHFHVWARTPRGRAFCLAGNGRSFGTRQAADKWARRTLPRHDRIIRQCSDCPPPGGSARRAEKAREEQRVIRRMALSLGLDYRAARSAFLAAQHEIRRLDHEARYAEKMRQLREKTACQSG